MDGTGEHMLSEISQVVSDKYHMISPLSGTLSKKIFFYLFCKQNIIRDIETNNLTVTRGEMVGDNGGKKVKVFQE